MTKTAIIRPEVPATGEKGLSAVNSAGEGFLFFSVKVSAGNPVISFCSGLPSRFKTDSDRSSIFRMLHSLAPGDIKRLRTALALAHDSGRGDVVYRIMVPSGIRLVRHQIVMSREGEELRADHLLLDVTTEYARADEVKLSEERFRKLFETAEDLIFILDGKGNFILINQNGALAIEYIPDEMTGRHFLEFVTDTKKADVARSFSEIVKSGQIVTFESAFLSKYGKTIIFEINARVTSSAVVPEGVLGIGRNITARAKDQDKMRDLNSKLIEANRIISIERDRARQKISVLEELNRLKNDFLSNISHELRTPLASIIGFAETIHSDTSMAPEMRDEFNSIILNEAKRLSRLINNVLDISRIEEGTVTLNKEYFKLDEVLEPLLEAYTKQTAEKGVTFSYELPPQEVLLYADKENFLRVTDNLLSNAVKFTDPGGRITLFIKTFYREIEIIVTDTGVGIPKNDIPFIYQKFYRVSRPGAQIPGTGLGLALTKQIIDLHKGMITVRSEENKGTTFVVKLPIIKQRTE
ncbi:MAG: PAS domain S-box protein [Ignavibacteriaceae bacterium]|nr:PAS domain S-box protein [Ignavibacteriaceae bacterium]